MLQWIISKQRGALKTTALGIVLFAVVFCLANFCHVSSASAQSIADPNSTLSQGVEIIEEPLGLPSTDIRVIIARIIRIALGLVGIILLVMIIYAGFLWMTAGGNEEQIGRAKKILVNGVIGLLIILSAYSIVYFVMRVLGVEGQQGETAPTAIEETTQNFRGSGALGRIVRDHYPARDERGVPRNTKIVVTFNKPILVSDFTQDSNNNGILGDCLTPMTDWLASCDQAILGNDTINITRTIEQDGEMVATPIGGAAVLASYVTEADGQSRVYSIVLKPLDDLGSEQEEVTYTVRLGRNIRLALDGNPSAFESGAHGNNYYEWMFTCSKETDTTPPYVQNVYPNNLSRVTKNTAIQITFSKPIDPTGVQGKFIFNAGNDFYFLENSRGEEGSYIYLASDNSTVPIGNFNLVNNYRTLEFSSTLECGANACGNKVFCLPVCDEGDANCSEDGYRVLLKAALTMDAANNSFEAVPFSGIADLAGNALDSGERGVVETAPRDVDLPVFPNQEKPDNYFWNFTVTKELDTTSPFLNQITPGLDAENVLPDAELKMVFSKIMNFGSLYNIGVEEDPSPSERCAGQKDCAAVPLWKVPAIKERESGENFTTVLMSHGPFLDSQNFLQYYFPSITSAVVDINGNCLYPGKGPGGQEQINARRAESLICNDEAENQMNCCAVAEAGPDEAAKAFCCNGVPNKGATVAECINYLTGS